MSTTKDLWDARYLLQRVAGTLEGAASGLSAWWRGAAIQRALVEATADLGQAQLHLAGSPLAVPSELLDRAHRWGTGEASAADLRADRDEIVAMLGAVGFVLDQLGADETNPDASWFEKTTGGTGWSRVRLGRASYTKVGSAG